MTPHLTYPTPNEPHRICTMDEASSLMPASGSRHRHGIRCWLSKWTTYKCTYMTVCSSLCFVALLLGRVHGASDDATEVAVQFKQSVGPFLTKYCVECHNADVRESGIRVDQLDASYEDTTLKLWEAIEKLVQHEEMPPVDAQQPTAEERLRFLKDVQDAMGWARTREVKRNGNIRRLTVSQYARTLKELLGIAEELTGILPPDGISKDGFSNNSQTLQLNPLQLEAYLQIAERALELVMVDETAAPTVQTFQMEFGKGINSEPYRGELVLGALNQLLPNQDFVVTEVAPKKAFEFQSFEMQRKFRFIEGYQGNDTVRGWRDFDSIYHAVFACMRGSEGYPKGRAYESVAAGLLMRPAIPSSEIFGESSTYGPHANFKIALRELPERGNFRVRVWASKYEDALLLDAVDEPIAEDVAHSTELLLTADKLRQEIEVAEEGVYQIDLATPQMLAAEVAQVTDQKFAPVDLQLQIGERIFGKSHAVAPFMLIRLKKGPVDIGLVDKVNGGDCRIRMLKLDAADPKVSRFERFEQRNPAVGVYVGLRRDCGSTLNPVGVSQPVRSTDLQEFVFEGAINNFPRPEVEPENVNYLAGIREIGVRCEYSDGRDMPRLLVRKIEFEGPYFEQWPPQNYVNLMQGSSEPLLERERAEKVIGQFASRAFRRPAMAHEIASLMKLWDNSEPAATFSDRIRPLLLVILTSPQFLFLIERSESSDGEPIDDWELASKLSYFLWDGPPDATLQELVAQGKLRTSLTDVVKKMLDDPRYRFGAESFVSQWLSLDKFEVVNTDGKKFPKLTRTVKAELRREPIEFWLNKVHGNKSLLDLYRSDEVVVNDVLASYYGLSERVEAGLEFVPVKHDRESLGGILSFAAIHAGLSDGREPNPVKRGAWLARKIIAEPPGDPPPNVPALEDLTQLTLRQRLEKHRDVEGCSKCHQGIDPWGLAFEEFDAGGLHRNEEVDSSTELADGTKLQGFNEFRIYLLSDKREQLAFSLARHLSIYANGKSLSYKDEMDLRQRLDALKANEYRLQDVLECVITSDAFLLK